MPRLEADVVATVRAQEDRADALRAKRLLIPGAKIDGWLMHVTWVTTRDKYGDMIGRDLHHVPPNYEFALRVPEDTSPRTDYRLWGFNYSFDAKRYGIPNERLRGFNDGDWVVVSGIVDSDTKIRWERVKDDDFPILTIGHCTLTDIKKLTEDESAQGK